MSPPTQSDVASAAWQMALQSAGLADRAPSSPNLTKSAVASRRLSEADMSYSNLRRVADLVGRSTVTIKELTRLAIGVRVVEVAVRFVARGAGGGWSCLPSLLDAATLTRSATRTS